MTLLTLAQRVTDEVGLPRPTAVATGTDQLARQLFALANSTIEDLHKLDWPTLLTPYEITTVADQESYALPTDFKRLVRNTAYNASSYYAIRSQLAPTEWQRQAYSRLSGVGMFKLRLTGYPRVVSITPVPQVADTIVFEYVTSKPVIQDGGATYSTLFTMDNDTPLIPEEIVRMGLKWRIKHAKGLEYSEDYNEYVMLKKTLFAQEIGLEDVAVATRGISDTPELTDGYVQENGFG